MVQTNLLVSFFPLRQELWTYSSHSLNELHHMYVHRLNLQSYRDLGANRRLVFIISIADLSHQYAHLIKDSASHQQIFKEGIISKCAYIHNVCTYYVHMYWYVCKCFPYTCICTYFHISMYLYVCISIWKTLSQCHQLYSLWRIFMTLFVYQILKITMLIWSSDGYNAGWKAPMPVNSGGGCRYVCMYNICTWHT